MLKCRTADCIQGNSSELKNYEKRSGMSNRFFLYQFQHRALDTILQRPKMVILLIAIVTLFFPRHIPNPPFRSSFNDGLEAQSPG